MGGVRPVGACRPPRERDPRGEQRARRGYRPTRRKAHARGEAGARRRSQPIRRDACGRVRRAHRDRGVRRAHGVGAAAAAVGPAGDPTAADRPHPHRRPVVERRARRHRPVARGVLAAALDRGARLVKRRLARLSIPLREPFATAGGVVAERELVLLRLEDDDGAVGYGEAAPLTPYDGVTLDEVVHALLGGCDDGPPQAHAAEEMALLDLEANRAGRAIGEPGADAIAVNRTLAGGPPAEVADRAAEGVREGYSCFKLKVGLPDDAERVAAVREALGEAAANGLNAFISSTLDGPWGISAALQLAAGERVQLACGLATLELFDASLALALPPPSDGLLVVPQGPGLGLAIDDEVIREVLVEELGD